MLRGRSQRREKLQHSTASLWLASRLRVDLSKRTVKAMTSDESCSVIWLALLAVAEQLSDAGKVDTDALDTFSLVASSKVLHRFLLVAVAV